jgi:hypothetical protein
VSGDSAFAFAASEVLRAATGRSFASAAAKASTAGLAAGIELPADERAGKKLGTAAGTKAWALARRYFAGTVLP